MFRPSAKTPKENVKSFYINLTPVLFYINLTLSRVIFICLDTLLDQPCLAAMMTLFTVITVRLLELTFSKSCFKNSK